MILRLGFNSQSSIVSGTDFIAFADIIFKVTDGLIEIFLCPLKIVFSRFAVGVIFVKVLIFFEVTGLAE